jgi:CheY-like chemotaxis protein
VRYIELLQLLGWVRNSNDGSYSVLVTEQGKHYRSILSGLLDGTKHSEAIVSSKIIDSIGDAANTPKVNGITGTDKYQGKDGFNVMLVDDEEDILLTFQGCLKSQGFNVRTFTDPKEALENISSVDSSYYDLVITDIRMKKMNGLQLYQWIRAINPNIRVIFVTALDAIEEMISMVPGITGKDIIRKPVDNQTFVKFVNKAISEARSEQSRSLTASAR